MSNLTERQKEFFNFLNSYLEENTSEDALCDSYREDMFQYEYRNDSIVTESEWGTISVKSIDCYGGEGQGDAYWSVYKFTAKDGTVVNIQFDGWYQSYNGSVFTEMFPVQPYEVTVTKFKQIH